MTSPYRMPGQRENESITECLLRKENEHLLEKLARAQDQDSGRRRAVLTLLAVMPVPIAVGFARPYLTESVMGGIYMAGIVGLVALWFHLMARSS